jgi:hypothetical protein
LRGGQVRRAAEQVVSAPAFDQFIMLCILVNCVFLALTDPTTDVVPRYQTVMDSVFLVIFTSECVVKSTA